MRKLFLVVLSAATLFSCSKEKSTDQSFSKKSTYSYSETWLPSGNVDTAIAQFISDIGNQTVSDMNPEEALFYLEASANKNKAAEFATFEVTTRDVDTLSIIIDVVQQGDDYIVEADELIEVYETIDGAINVPSGLSFWYFDLSSAISTGTYLRVVAYSVSASSAAFNPNGNHDFLTSDDRYIGHERRCNSTWANRTAPELFSDKVTIQKDHNFFLQYYNSYSVRYYISNITYSYNPYLQMGYMPLGSDHLPGQPNSVVDKGYGGNYWDWHTCMYKADYETLSPAAHQELQAYIPTSNHSWIGVDIDPINTPYSGIGNYETHCEYSFAAYGVPVL